VAVGLIVDDETVICCEGVTSVDDPLPVTPETLFQVGSVTKSFTAAAALAILEARAIDSSALVASVAPGLDLGEFGDAITFEHLLTHTGGWQGDWALMNSLPCRDSGALAQLVAMAARVPRVFSPGTAFSYDNFGYCVLGRALEILGGAPFDEILAQTILGPLGMHRSMFAAEDAVPHRLCAGHYADGPDRKAAVVLGREPWADHWSMRRCLWPTGGLITCLDDALVWARFHLGGDPSQQFVLSATAREAMRQPVVDSGGQGVKAGRGWHLRYASGLPVVVHTGLTQGFNAAIILVPDRQSALVVMINSSAGQAWLPVLTKWYLEDALGLVPEALTPMLPPVPPTTLEGDYETVTRRIVLADSGEQTVRATVEDTGPTWSEHKTWIMSFAAPNRLVALDDPMIRMEYGFADQGPWVRYRGRVHVPLRE